MNRENTDHAKREADLDKPRGPEVTGCDLRGCCEAAFVSEERGCCAESVGGRERERRGV